MENEYLNIMIQSLQKKLKILDKIIEMNKKQHQILSEEELDSEAFEQNVQEKSDLVEQIKFLDEGFEDLYDRVKTVINTEKQEHREEILILKQLITEITDRSVNIQSEEVRNRKLVEVRFSQERKKVRNMKNSSTVANQYYKTMTRLNQVDAQFMDRKK